MPHTKNQQDKESPAQGIGNQDLGGEKQKPGFSEDRSQMPSASDRGPTERKGIAEGVNQIPVNKDETAEGTEKPGMGQTGIGKQAESQGSVGTDRDRMHRGGEKGGESTNWTHKADQKGQSNKPSDKSGMGRRNEQGSPSGGLGGSQRGSGGSSQGSGGSSDRSGGSSQGGGYGGSQGGGYGGSQGGGRFGRE